MQKPRACPRAWVFWFSSFPSRWLKPTWLFPGWCLLAAAAFGSTWGRTASATEAVFHPELVDATRKLEGARGPEVYMRLRDLFRLHGLADSEQVEEALRAADSPKLSEPARVYARVLRSLIRTRRGDLQTASKIMREQGFVDRWLVVGPFDNEGKSGLDRPFEPEATELEPAFAERTFSGKERPVRWRRPPEVFGLGRVDFNSLLRPSTAICGYATTFVSDPGLKRGTRDVTVWVGSSGAFKLFWNGREVLRDPAYRGYDVDRRGTKVRLLPGQNQVTIKACGDDRAPLFSVRVGNAFGGADSSLTFKSEPASQPAGDHEKELTAEPELPPTSKVPRRERPGLSLPPDGGTKGSPLGPLGELGPLSQFEVALERNDRDPELLYQYALYLEGSSGDDPTQHLARDLAMKAAELSATVPRLLLSARLSEDRNQQRQWLDRAEKTESRSRKDEVELLLARARHARTSPNWRDAFRYVDQVLELEPDNTEAVAARVALYNEAGLPRTALAFLNGALERNPHDAQLRHTLTRQLSTLDRTVEAQLAARAYAATRSDDRSFLTQMVQLGVLRKDKPAAEHWLGTMLAQDPDSAWVLGLAATTHRSFGEMERGIAALERALTLAPEDVSTLRAMADFQGQAGRKDLQVNYLRKLLQVQPQEKSVRQYLEYLEPQSQNVDEAYAYEPSKFLKLRHLPAQGESQRTLRDLTVTTVFENGLSKKFRQVVFQPLSDAAAASLRQYAFVYEADTQSVQLRGARVFRADGRVDEAIESGEGPTDDPSIAMYTSSRAFYVQFPRLEPNDVVELRYRIDDITPRNEFADYFGDMVYLQSTEPVQNAEYVLITPKSRSVYVDHSLSGLKRESTVQGDQRVLKLFAESIPPLVSEPAMPPMAEALGFVHVTTYKDWRTLGQWYWGLIRDQLDLDAETRRLAERITVGKTSELEKVKAVYDWVVTNTRYVALEFGIYGFKPRRCVQTVNRGWGDCKDKAVVIVSLLKALGIPSTMVLVRTQMRGNTSTKLPSLAWFDHAIAYVPSLDLYLDGTAEFAGSFELPLMDREAQGLLVNQGDAVPVVLPSRKPGHDKVTRVIEAEMQPNGKANLSIQYEASGFEAAEFRRRYHAKATAEERLRADLGQAFSGLSLETTQIKTSDLDDIEAKASVEVKGAASGFGRVEAGQISLRVTPEPRLTATYASLSKRQREVRLLSRSDMNDTFVVHLPSGYKVARAPSPVAQKSPFGSYSIEVEANGESVRVKSSLVIEKTRVAPRDYAAWQAFCRAADAAFTTRLILERSR